MSRCGNCRKDRSTRTFFVRNEDRSGCGCGCNGCTAMNGCGCNGGGVRIGCGCGCNGGSPTNGCGCGCGCAGAQSQINIRSLEDCFGLVNQISTPPVNHCCRHHMMNNCGCPCRVHDGCGC